MSLFNRFSLSLNFRLIGSLLCVALLPLVSFSFLALIKSEESLRQAVFYTLTSYAKKQEALIGEWLEDRKVDILALAGSDILHSMEPERVRSYLDVVKRYNPNYASLILVGPDRKTIIDTDGKRGIDLSDQPYVQAALGGRLAIAMIATYSQTGQPILGFAAPILSPAGKVAGAIAAVVPLERLNDLVYTEAIGATGKAFLIDHEGRLLTKLRHVSNVNQPSSDREHEPLKLKLDSYATRQGLAGQEGTAEYLDHDGVPVLGSYHPDVFEEAGWVFVVEQDVAEALAGVDELRRLILVGVLVTALIALVIAMLLARRIAQPLGSIAQMVERIAQLDLPNLLTEMQAVAGGDLTRQVNFTAYELPTTSGDEIGRVIQAFNTMLTSLRSVSQVFNQMTSSLRELVTEVSSSVSEVVWASHQFESAANESEKATAQINETIQQVARMAFRQSQEVGEITLAIQQLTQAIEGIAQGAQEQALAVERSSLTVDKMSKAIQRVMTSAEVGAQAADTASDTARAGSVTLSDAVRGMEVIRQAVLQAATRVQEMSARSTEIGQIVETIQDIAAQTNLLALNAAIEAARAGEQGRGFAVVADEVRKLAERSAQSTKEIGELIAAVQRGTSQTVQAMNEGLKEVESGAARAQVAGQALSEILQSAEMVNTHVKEIAQAAHEMGNLSQELTRAMSNVSTIVEENTASAEQMSSSSSQVTKLVGGMGEASDQNSIAAENLSVAVQEMSAQMAEMVQSAQGLAEMGRRLEMTISRFTGAARDSVQRPATWGPDADKAVRSSRPPAQIGPRPAGDRRG